MSIYLNSNDKLAIVEKIKLAIAHCAKVVQQLHSETASIYGENATIAEISLPRDAAVLEALLKHLDDADALTDEDEWVFEVLTSARKLTHTIP